MSQGKSDTTRVGPKEGETWRNEKGAVRVVRGVDDDDVVTYSRAADGHHEWRSIMVRDWCLWVEGTNAVLSRRAPKGAPNKEWGYVNGD